MSDMKTVENEADVAAFLASVENRGRAEDAETVVAMMMRVTGQPPKMWGDSLIGFDRYEYRRKDGSEHQFFLTGLSPRKANLTVYIMPGFSEYQDRLDRLGPHKHSVSCLYLGRLNKIDLDVLEELIAQSVADMRAKYH